jgi:hypothetical protein
MEIDLCSCCLRKVQRRSLLSCLHQILYKSIVHQFIDFVQRYSQDPFIKQGRLYDAAMIFLVCRTYKVASPPIETHTSQDIWWIDTYHVYKSQLKSGKLQDVVWIFFVTRSFSFGIVLDHTKYDWLFNQYVVVGASLWHKPTLSCFAVIFIHHLGRQRQRCQTIRIIILYITSIIY